VNRIGSYSAGVDPFDIDLADRSIRISAVAQNRIFQINRGGNQSNDAANLLLIYVSFEQYLKILTLSIILFNFDYRIKIFGDELRN